MILSTLAVLVTFALVILIHESGHFLVCRRLGVRVERFAFGFGPELLGFDSGGTRFSLCAIPLGGFVKPAGEALEEFKGAPDEYFSRSWKERFAIVAAGPVMNYALAFLLFSGVIYIKGIPQPTQLPVIGDVVPGYPAAEAGLQAGDAVLKLDGAEVNAWQDMAERIHQSPGKKIKLLVRRGSEDREIALVPRLDEVKNIGLIGIAPKMEYAPQPLLASFKEGARQCWYWTAFTVKTLASKIYRREKLDVAGPVGIVQMVSRAAHSAWEDLVFLIALISVAIGFFNVLPVPLLDGGHAALYLWEGLSGRKLTEKTLQVANSIGLCFLLFVLVFATYNDILRLIKG